jgi:DMSO/TMAO reductase YedYZ molybdopterin-dependent catalytic subunit
MLVYSQNGERLRPQQGYPLRLLLPGFEGNMNIKWLRRLHLAAEPTYSREETSKYTDLMPDGSAREFTFFMEAKSIITRPSGGQRLNSPGSIRWTIDRVVAGLCEAGAKWESAQDHVARPDFAGRVRLGLRIADCARNFDIERGSATKPGFLLAADIMSIEMYRPCRKCRRPAQQDNRNGKQPYDSHQTHLLAPSC